MEKRIIFTPEAKDYATYSVEEIREMTEKMYEKTKGIYEVIDREEAIYRNKIESILVSNRKAEEILDLLDDETGKLLCANDGYFRTFSIICHISQCEEMLGEPNILQNVVGIDDSCAWLQKRVFEIRRLEMAWLDDEDLAELMELILQKKISYICLAEIVHKCAIERKVQAADNMAHYLHQKGCTREAMLFLVWLDKILPYSERKIMCFANALLEMGQIKLAYEKLLKYQNPDEKVMEMQRALLGLL